MAVIAERDGNGYLAYALYEAILASMLEVYDSTDDPKRCARHTRTRGRNTPNCLTRVFPCVRAVRVRWCVCVQCIAV
jgi:hypothetical protein